MEQQEIDGAAHILREFVLAMVRTSPQSALSRTAAGTLSVLDRLGPQPITTLADIEAITQPAMTGLVQRLESTGFITRQPDPLDGRAALIAITDDGHTTLTERRRKHEDAIASRVAQLGPEQLSVLLAALPVITTLTEIC
ncbi:MAG: MarR family transcriptional regulator [Kineosporiaceae bacterium]|nr:MarR family transcriptional regulator [Aeromicrobium sp.]